MNPNLQIEILLTDISQCGGTERTVLSIADYLYTKGYKVSLTSLFSSSEDQPYFPVHNNIPICHLGIKSYTNKNALSKVFGWFESIIKVKKHLKNSKSIVILGTSRNTNFLSILFKKKNQSVIGCEHFAFNVPMNSFLRKIRDIAYRKLTKLVVLTNKDLQYYTRKRIKTTVIPNAIPIENKNLDLSKKDKIAIAVGRHSKQKAFDSLIRIWNRIYRDIPDWKLIIIGEGPLLRSNKDLAMQLGVKNIEFKGFTKEIDKFYTQASLYLMTSIYEAFPMVLIEAKYFGCINIAYNCDTGPAEIIKQGEDGFIIEMNNTTSFENKILDLIHNPEKIKKMQVQAHNNSKVYSKENVLYNWINLIDIVQHG